MSTVDGVDLTAQDLQHFHPLGLIAGKHIARLLDGAAVVRLDKGRFLFRKMPRPGTAYFVLEGTIDVRESFENRTLVEAGSRQSRFSLEELYRNGASARAHTDAVVLLLQRDAIDRLMASTDEASLDAVLVADTDETAEAAYFGDGYSEDWMARLLDSPLMSHLSASSIQRCFIELERMALAEGTNVVQAGTLGDYFYILLEGNACVLTDEAGPFAGQSFELVPGDYFGEEALVADTIRNATVRMASDGVVGRLDRGQFDAIFKSSLVQTIDLAKAKRFLRSAGIGFEVIDVRFPLEYRCGHVEGSSNVPVVALRKRLAELDRGRTWLVTPEGGRRSELAVYLLRQAGLNAYLLTPS